jgi:hypothetical protein
VQAIGLGAGLTFDGSGNLSNSAIPTVSASGNNTFSGTNTFSNAVTATGNVTLGDATADTVAINGTMLYLPAGSTAPTVGHVLTCNNVNGTVAWAAPTGGSTFTPSLTDIGSSAVVVLSTANPPTILIQPGTVFTKTNTGNNPLITASVGTWKGVATCQGADNASLKEPVLTWTVTVSTSGTTATIANFNHVPGLITPALSSMNNVRTPVIYTLTRVS